MKWHFLDPDLSGFRDGVPDVRGSALVMSPIHDYRAELIEPEPSEMTRMAEVRQLGFASGRHCAHLAQDLLGLIPSAVLREDRVPIWPEHSVGSITHSSTIAAAFASTAAASVGVDIEEAGRVDDKLFRILFTDWEKEKIPSYDFDAAGVMFSAKEAGYKAIYPIGQAFIGFQQAEIILEPLERSFTIKYLGDHAPNKALHTGRGHWQIYGEHILTLFVIP